MFIRHNNKTYLIPNNKKQEYKGFIEGLKFFQPDWTDDYNRALTWWLNKYEEKEKQSIFKRLINYINDSLLQCREKYQHKEKYIDTEYDDQGGKINLVEFITD